MTLTKYDKEILAIMFTKATNDPHFFESYDGCISTADINNVFEKVMGE